VLGRRAITGVTELALELLHPGLELGPRVLGLHAGEVDAHADLVGDPQDVAGEVGGRGSVGCGLVRWHGLVSVPIGRTDGAAHAAGSAGSTPQLQRRSLAGSSRGAQGFR
jgi:hypothetical protein